EDLVAGGADVNGAALFALLRGRFASRLTRLCVPRGPYQADRWRALASPALTGSLRRLYLAGSPLAGSGLESLLALPGRRNLTALKLDYEMAPTEGMAEAVAGSPFWANATAFETDDVPLPEPSLRLLCQRNGPAGLKKLDLLAAAVGRGVRHLSAAPFA